MKSVNSIFVRRTLTATIILAVLIRIIVAMMLGDNADPISGAYDQQSYDMLAQQIVDGKGFTFPVQWYPFTPPNTPTAHWSYLYTLFLAGVYVVFGHHPLMGRLSGALISGLIFYLTFRIGQKLFGVWVGLAAAVLTASYAYLIFFNVVLMTQTFYILSVLAVLNLALDLSSQPTRRAWILFGAMIGIGALTRQTLLLVSPLLLITVMWANHLRLHWRDVFLSVGVIVLFVLPFTIYNYFTFHDFLLLNSNSGFWFYSSNHPGQGTNFNPNYTAPIPDNLYGLSEPAKDRALMQAGIGFIVADPWRFILLSINRIKDYYWIVPSDASTLTSNLGRLFSFALYLPFFVWGLWLSRRYWRACFPLYLYIAFDAILCLISWAAPRYRLPSDVVMMPFAGLAVVDIATRLGVVAHVEKWVARRSAA